jgi:hypothetical protein
MSLIDRYFAAHDAALAGLKEARNVDAIKALIDPIEGPSSGESFWGADGGDLHTVLVLDAGWTTVRMEADYYWVVTNSNGEFVAYTEGDISYSDNTYCGG